MKILRLQAPFEALPSFTAAGAPLTICLLNIMSEEGAIWDREYRNDLVGKVGPCLASLFEENQSERNRDD
jgi:hypothetical protein